ncbi:WD domain, G-beta repeat protein [Rhizoctonia solani]|uniref:WD domain, G-beta repeat protein n=1 Tax=Rhizoctonia solani TaxID=456999 RepID=A0A8H8P3G2_9AGAM|nr:WD domain, G-beta repeat protein [Rhizoctonia solani]QRW24505.1 WD domain, G-beta repeat protein [Rhizoctonia solani]
MVYAPGPRPRLYFPTAVGPGSRRDVNEAEEKYRQMGWEAMRETVAYYSERGDLQMSAALSTVGGVELGISPETHERIVDAYLAAYVRNTPNPSLQRGKPRMFPWGPSRMLPIILFISAAGQRDGSSTAANSRTSTILESDPKSGTPSMQSLGLGAETEKPFDDAASVKTEKTQDTLITDPGNRNSMELPAQDEDIPALLGVDIIAGPRTIVKPPT